MQLGKTEKTYLRLNRSIVYANRKDYYHTKQFVRQQRAMEQIIQYIKSKFKITIAEHHKRLYNYLINQINLDSCQ